MKSNRPLVIDAQLLQTAAWDRGMGHYCRSLLAAFVGSEDAPDVTLILNRNLPIDAKKKDVLKYIVPGAKQVELDLPTLSAHVSMAKRQATRKLDTFLSDTYGAQEVDFLILQLFTFDYCAAFPTRARKLVICYDLIPLMHWSMFSRLFAPTMYFPHLKTLLEADLVLAISETTKCQLQDQIGIESKRIVSLNGAYIHREADGTSKPADIVKDTRFILMPSADLPHKNNEKAVQAFERFNRELGDIFSLVITSNISEETQRLLNCYSDKLIFTGSVSDETLEYLYQQSDALLFVSSVEGLGLPILEAVRHDKPVVCSSIEVFQEISKSAFYYCDTVDTESITAALREAIVQTHWESKKLEYDRINEEYTWPNSAQKLQQALSELQKTDSVPGRPTMTAVIPHPATTSGELGMLVQSLIPALEQQVELRVCVSRDEYVNEQKKPYFLPYLLPLITVDQLLIRHSAARPVYFIDDSSASSDILRVSLQRPGVCFITSNRAELLLRYLADDGYITSELYDTGTALAKNNLANLLRSAGNTIYSLSVHNDKVEIKSVPGAHKLSFETHDKWSLASFIVTCAAGKSA